MRRSQLSLEAIAVGFTSLTLLAWMSWITPLVIRMDKDITKMSTKMGIARIDSISRFALEVPAEATAQSGAKPRR